MPNIPGPRGRSVITVDEVYTSPHYTRYVPLVVRSAKGCVITDEDGNKFLDFTAGIGVVNCGHRDPAVDKAVIGQVNKFTHMCTGDYYSEPCARFSAELAAVWPGKSRAKVFFTNSGTESIEGAIKLARKATGRQRMLAFLGAFHGRTCGSLSLTGSKALQRGGFGPMLAGVDHAPYNDLDYVRTLFKKTVPPQDVAAIFVEPLQGEGGYIPATDEFLHGLRGLCDEHGIMLVADEVQSGFGRTGRMFCVEHFGVEPDILCLAKGIANGMPLGAVMAKSKVMNKMEPGCHGSTYGGNAVCLAAARASLRRIKDDLLEESQDIGRMLFGRLCELANAHPMQVAKPTGLGLMRGIEIRAYNDPCPKLRDCIVAEAFRRGLLLLGCGEATIRFCPPLCMTENEMERGMDILAEATEAAIVGGDYSR